MKFDLHPHQEQALAELRHAILAGQLRVMVQAPTGAGKTILAARIIHGTLAKGKRVLFVVPFLSLVEQTVDALAEQGIGSVGVIQGCHPMTDARQPVQVASLQTLQRRPLPAADLVIIDEAHRWYTFVGEWMTRPEWAKVPFIGLSATPWTKGLGKHYGGLVVAATTAELIEKDFLSRFRVFAPTHPDLSGVKVVRGDYHEGQLSGAMNRPTLVGDIVQTWLRLGEDRPSLCFGVDRAHARAIADAFEAAGVATGYVDANTLPDEREKIAERLRQGQIKIVCNVFCLTTGVDWDVRCIILARPTKSEILYTQIIGRGLRRAKGKMDCLILDHSDTTLTLGFVTDIHHQHLDEGRHSKCSNAGRDKLPSLPKECPSCSFLKPAGVHKCPSCGFVPERRSAIEAMDGDLVQLNGRRKDKQEATPHSRQDVYSMLLWVQQERGYKPGYASVQFRERYDDRPRGLRVVLKEPDTLFLNWQKSRQIAFFKRRQKENSRAA